MCPYGSTNQIGWYAPGTKPGEQGSAVLAAHVYAAFAKLKYVKPGSDIYVVRSDNTTLRFVALDKQQYRLPSLSPSFLFNQKDAHRLNLITCAGSYIPAAGTYDQRLVVFAQLANTVKGYGSAMVGRGVGIAS